MHAWASQQAPASGTPSMLRCQSLHSLCNPTAAGRIPASSGRVKPDARQRLPEPPCGEKRSANRTRWVGSDPDSAVSPATSEATTSTTAKLPNLRSADGLEPQLSAVEAMERHGAAERDPIGCGQPAWRPPLAGGNEGPAVGLPATSEEASSLVGCCLHCLHNYSWHMLPSAQDGCLFTRMVILLSALAGMGCGSSSRAELCRYRPLSSGKPAPCAGQDMMNA